MFVQVTKKRLTITKILAYYAHVRISIVILADELLIAGQTFQSSLTFVTSTNGKAKLQRVKYQNVRVS